MKTTYLIRFDDICPTMNWATWAKLETILDSYKIKPLLAVVPDNQDPHLQIAPPREDFWDWLRMKQQEGWCIGMHGYQHLFVTQDSGLLGFHKKSEFAGLPFQQQKQKLQSALEIFLQNDIRPQVFVAPAHSFDIHTLKALMELGIDVISDGFFLFPQRQYGILWIPQQIWRWYRMPFGVWTICFHHNKMTSEQVVQFAKNVDRFAPQLSTFAEVMQLYSHHTHASSSNLLFAMLWRFALRTKHCFRR